MPPLPGHHRHRCHRPVMAAVLALCTGIGTAQAQTQNATDAPPAFTLDSNLALTSQYVFRGINYSQEKPAIQGGFDLAHTSGAYLGVWASSLSSDAIAGATVELDVYGGYARSVGDVAYDLGLLRFGYPGARLAGESYNTVEAYASVGWKWLTFKYSHTLTDYFAMNAASMGHGDDSKGSGYIEANLAIALAQGWAIDLHAGHQRVQDYGAYDFSDYKAQVSKGFDGGWTVALAVTGTNADRALYRIGHVDTSASRWLVTLSRRF